MKILSLHIDGFGKLNDLDLSFEDGLNVLYGKNEAGKSTLHTFIRGMLFGIERCGKCRQGAFQGTKKRTCVRQVYVPGIQA